MNERLTADERRALLAGDGADPLTPDDAEGLDVLAAVLADPSTWAEPRPELEATVLAAVADAPRAAPRPSASGGPRRARQQRGRRVLTAAVGVAASVALVVGVLTITGGGDPDPDFRAALTATALAPRARASADVTHNRAGFRIALDAHGLGRLPAGAYYQAWLKNARGQLVAIGTFSSSDGSIVLWSGVDPKEYRGMTVTIEPDDDNPASSGRRVLVGTLRPT
jgi:hypothetical protein